MYLKLEFVNSIFVFSPGSAFGMGLMVDSMIDREMTPFRQSNRDDDLNTPFVQRKTDTAMDAGECRTSLHDPDISLEKKESYFKCFFAETSTSNEPCRLTAEEQALLDELRFAYSVSPLWQFLDFVWYLNSICRVRRCNLCTHRNYFSISVVTNGLASRDVLRTQRVHSADRDVN